MQSRTKTIKRSLLLLPLLLLFVSSCLKKVEGVDEIDTNIFDREYAGDIWYNITDIEQVTNGVGQLKARLTITIPKSNLPGLVPSSIKIHAEGDGLAVTVIDFPLVSGGSFKQIIDLPYTGVGEYCIKLGVYLEEENAAINLFDACTSI